MNAQQAAAVVTVEAILARLEARARDVKWRSEQDAAGLTDRYARGLAEGHADAMALIVAEVEAIRGEVQP